MSRRFDHVDLRMNNLAQARPFYERLLPALGFTQDMTVEGWLQFEVPGVDGPAGVFRRHRVANAPRQ
jgi:hypothetical protein